MVLVLMGNKNKVGFGQEAEIGQLADRIDVNVQVVIVEKQRTVADESDFQIAGRGLENVRFEIFLGIHGHAAQEKNTVKE